ncbi:MAG: sigma-70 family RNA polymerase sigma factor [Bacteroidaceae bacterium]|nr:sigma-70 family RNA polymerase sigma factor [Bacteroidaceae bacterium]
MQPADFVNRYLPMCADLRRAAVVLLGNADDADDAVQEVMARLWQRRADLERMENARGYAFTTLRNHCLNRLKARREEVPIDAAAERGSPDDLAAQLERRSERRLVEQIIGTLPSKAARAMRLYHFAQLDLPEIAALTGQSEESLRRLLSRSRLKVIETYRKLNPPQR